MSGFEQYKSKHNKIKPTAVPKKPKKQADRTGKNGKAHLIVKGEPTGKFADTRGPRCIEMTIYRLTDHEFAGGHSCFFPTRLSCRINGETYEAAGDKTIFKGTINPGRIKFTAWFLESYWDTFTCKQNIGKRHQKTFYVDIKKNDNIKVFINYIYTDEKASIFAGVYTEVTVIKNGKKIKKFKETMVR